LANIKSQIKRIGQNNAARDRNKTVRSFVNLMKHLPQAMLEQQN
jgi:ribosomal protein S20